jgi:SAM-dependent methyltransferase
MSRTIDVSVAMNGSPQPQGGAGGAVGYPSRGAAERGSPPSAEGAAPVSSAKGTRAALPQVVRGTGERGGVRVVFGNLARRVREVTDSTRSQHYRNVVARSLLERLPADPPSLRLLDFGCGYECALLAVLPRTFASLSGVDVTPLRSAGLLGQISYQDGPLLHRLVGASVAWCSSSAFERAVLRESGQSTTDLDVRQYDGLTLPWADGSFDLVVSNAVLQELPLPLDPFAAELARVLGPGGRIDLEWHNYFAPSGHLTGPTKSWAHLLGGRSDLSCNKVTPAQVLEGFSPYFESLEVLTHDQKYRIEGRDPGYLPEGDLTEAARVHELRPDIDPHLLTSRGFILTGKVAARAG